MNLRDLIVEQLNVSDSPDPHVVAAAVDAATSSHDVRAAYRELLADAVREVIRQQRGTSPAEGPSPNGKRGLGAMTSDPSRMRHFVPGRGWAFESDMSADDCDVLAAWFETQAGQMAARASYWRGKARKLRGDDAQGVAA